MNQPYTMAQGKKKVRDALANGDEIKCPCCEKRVHADRRPIHAEMARFIVKLVKLYEEEEAYYHTTEVIPKRNPNDKSSTDASYLCLWEPEPLLERHPDISGYYMPTQAGIDFVEGKIQVRAAAFIFGGEVVRWDTKKVSIHDAAKKKFNLEEVLGRPPKFQSVWAG